LKGGPTQKELENLFSGSVARFTYLRSNMGEGYYPLAI
jgi:hypothetical protein